MVPELRIWSILICIFVFHIFMTSPLWLVVDPQSI